MLCNIMKDISCVKCQITKLKLIGEGGNGGVLQLSKRSLVGDGESKSLNLIGGSMMK